MKPLSTDRLIVKRIQDQKRGKLFFPENFSDSGSSGAVRLSLYRLAKQKFIIRLAQGIYLYPKKDKELGIIYPSIEEIALTIAKRDKARIVPTGVHALNKLGLSTQVPMKIVFLTDGAPREIQIGKRSIKFKKTTPKNLMAKGEISSLVIQALREIGKENVTGNQLEKIKFLLRKEKPEFVIHDAGLAPAWITKIMLSAIEKGNEE